MVTLFQHGLETGVNTKRLPEAVVSVPTKTCMKTKDLLANCQNAAMQLCSLTFLVTTLTMPPARTSAESDFNTGCSGFSVTFRFLIDEDVVYEHVLEGHVYRRSTVTKATECHGLCRDDCRCVSMNYITNSEYDNCELNEANRHLEPASLRPKTGARYYELVRQYMIGVSWLKVLLNIHTDSEI